jgi:hypothetical protein
MAEIRVFLSRAICLPRNLSGTRRRHRQRTGSFGDALLAERRKELKH